MVQSVVFAQAGGVDAGQAIGKSLEHGLLGQFEGAGAVWQAGQGVAVAFHSGIDRVDGPQIGLIVRQDCGQGRVLGVTDRLCPDHRRAGDNRGGGGEHGDGADGDDEFHEVPLPDRAGLHRSKAAASTAEGKEPFDVWCGFGMRSIGLTLAVQPQGQPADLAEALENRCVCVRLGGQKDAIVQLGRL